MRVGSDGVGHLRPQHLLPDLVDSLLGQPVQERLGQPGDGAAEQARRPRRRTAATSTAGLRSGSTLAVAAAVEQAVDGLHALDQGAEVVEVEELAPVPDRGAAVADDRGVLLARGQVVDLVDEAGDVRAVDHFHQGEVERGAL